jgi:hypothetical protein
MFGDNLGLTTIMQASQNCQNVTRFRDFWKGVTKEAADFSVIFARLLFKRKYGANHCD